MLLWGRGWWSDEGYKVLDGVWVNMSFNMTSEVKVK